MKGKEKEQLYQKRNYDRYRFSMKELLKYMGQALALCIMADYLFYKSKWVLLLMLPVPVFYLKWQKNRMIRERRKNLNYQFKDALTSLSVAVQAGYSVESAVKTCVRDLERLYGKGTDIVEEFRYIESQQHISFLRRNRNDRQNSCLSWICRNFWLHSHLLRRPDCLDHSNLLYFSDMFVVYPKVYKNACI